jgi:hypothetical protein
LPAIPNPTTKAKTDDSTKEQTREVLGCFSANKEGRVEGSERRKSTREALPLDRLWKAEQIGGGKAICRQQSAKADQ